MATPRAAEYSVTWAMNADPPPAVGSIDPLRVLPSHQLIEIHCATWDLGDRPVTDRGAQRRYIHLVEEIAERGIRWRPPQLHAQRLGERGVVADSKPLQIPQALAAAQDPEHG